MFNFLIFWTSCFFGKCETPRDSILKFWKMINFRIGLAHNLPLGCLVDEDGKYIESVGSNLAGLFIMGK